MNNKKSQVLLVFRKSPRKWNYTGKVRCWNLHSTYCRYFRMNLLSWWASSKSGPGPWTQTWKTWTQKNLNPKKPRPRKTWTLKSLDPEKHGINIELKNTPDFRELGFIKTMRNVIYCLKVRVLTDIWTNFVRLIIVLIATQL